MGSLSLSGSMSIAMPLGGRPLVMTNWIPASALFMTESMARWVRILSCVTRVPSTSAMTSLMGLFEACGGIGVLYRDESRCGRGKFKTVEQPRFGEGGKVGGR